MQQSTSRELSVESSGAVTRAEIFQQPELWPVTVKRVPADLLLRIQPRRGAIISGAGSSAYAASAVAASWRGARAVPTTDLLLDAQSWFGGEGLLVSLARSGDSPESIGAVRKVQREFPAVTHLAITCNAEGALAKTAGVDVIVLDPRTNDRSLVMTSSFSNLALAGIALKHHEQLKEFVPAIARRAESLLPELDQRARAIAKRPISRLCVLASGPLYGAAKEASLKVLEMTAGQVIAVPETFLGLRHGPMSFLRKDSAVLCFLSSDPLARKYEEDLIRELRRKELGYLILIASPQASAGLSDELIPAVAPDLPDCLRTPFEIVFAQLLAYHLSLQAGLNPDRPSPGDVITRVVQGVQLHEE